MSSAVGWVVVRLDIRVGPHYGLIYKEVCG